MGVGTEAPQTVNKVCVCVLLPIPPYLRVLRQHLVLGGELGVVDEADHAFVWVPQVDLAKLEHR